MRPHRGVYVLLLAGAILASVGCDLLPRRTDRVVSRSSRPAAVARFASVPASESEFLVISQLVDQPAGSDYLNRGLWQEVTDPLPHELTTLLAANGLRVGVVCGKPPPELERLGTSEASSIGLVQQTFTAGRPRLIPVNGTIDSCQLQLLRKLQTDAENQTLTSADCALEVTTIAAEGGRVKVACVLQVQHGERQPFLAPSTDGTSLTRSELRPTIALHTMAFEVTLGRRDVLVMGATEQPAGTLGQACFFTSAGESLRQRVLVVQAGAASGGGDEDATPKSGGGPTSTATLSVAAQAWRGPRRTVSASVTGDISSTTTASK